MSTVMTLQDCKENAEHIVVTLASGLVAKNSQEQEHNAAYSLLMYSNVLKSVVWC